MRRARRIPRVAVILLPATGGLGGGTGGWIVNPRSRFGQETGRRGWRFKAKECDGNADGGRDSQDPDLKGRPWGSSSKTPRPGCRGPRSIPGQGTGPHRPHLRAPGLRLEGPHPTTGVQCSTPKNGGGEERQASGTGVVSKVGESKGVLSLQRGNPGAWVPGWTQGDPGPAAVCRDLLPQACCSPCKVTPSGQSRRHTSVLSRRRSLRSL